MTEKIQPIPQEFKKYGRIHTLIVRKVGYALYKGVNIKDEWICYELHKVRVVKGCVKDFWGKRSLSQNREVLAKDSEFGSYGWSFNTLGAAQRKMTKLIARDASKRVSALIAVQGHLPRQNISFLRKKRQDEPQTDIMEDLVEVAR